MSYWSPYEEEVPGSYPAYDGGEYGQYLDNMPYYNNQNQQNYGMNSGYSFYNSQNPYQNNYLDYAAGSSSSSQLESNSSTFPQFNGEPSTNQYSSEPNNGAIKRRPNERKNWNNGRKNDRYGSGRTFNGRNNRFNDYSNKGKDESKRERDSVELPNSSSSVNQPQEAATVVEENKDSSCNRNKYKTNPSNKQGGDGGRKYYQYNNKYKNNYDDGRRHNYNRSNNRDNRFENYDRGYQKYGGRGSNSHYENNDYAARSSNDYPREKQNWRRFDYNNKKCNNAGKVQKKLDAASQRERLEQMLSRRMLECLVCCEKIKHTDKVWSCEQCYHILHLACISAWANSSKLDNGWRCPACQNVCRDIPKHYNCYCGKTLEPRPVPGVIPHACGEVCMRKGRICEHKCTILCHPGPCPDCNIMVAKPCGCGATQQTVKCSADTEIVCDAKCNKLLDCGLHRCEMKCHPGPCNACDRTIQQTCYCEKVSRRVKCTLDFQGATSYACEDVCGRALTCGNHFCEKVCHAGACDTCCRDVTLIESCPCGRTKLEKVRTSCLDPIPCCDKICGKILNCGQPAAPHVCKNKCHEGDCPACPLTTFVRCRCGHMDKELPCLEVTTKADDARCEKKCTKKRLCGKHRCNQRCCIEVEHFCPLPCNHLLACGKHRCDRTCHSGRCPPCIETSFEELYCECGASVLYPPIPCGTKPPACNKPCSRQRPCGHEVNHNCHTGACPPCTVLCKRYCYGRHEQRSAIPCYQEDFSCGLPCGKQMPCGLHKCEKPCHLGKCPLPCKQKCVIKRAGCGHACGVPCHKPPCPETPCKQSVPITCACGLQKGSRLCIDLADEYRELEMAQLNDKMADLSKDNSVDLTDIVKTKKPSILKILECTEECRVVERNRRLAIGLQIRNPDLSQKLTPRYSEFMRGWAKKDSQFCQKIHDKLSELVQLSKQSKQKSRAHSFESMNRDKRHFVHEYCEHFGVESAAYDQEPNRNIVATATKDKSWLPSMSLLEVIQRENGQRKVPGPVLSSKSPVGKSESVALKLPGRVTKTQTPPSETVDYFDNPPL